MERKKFSRVRCQMLDCQNNVGRAEHKTYGECYLQFPMVIAAGMMLFGAEVTVPRCADYQKKEQSDA